MFGASALYHRPNWNDRARAVFRRLDHACIFLLIAGTNTPLALLALPPEQVGGRARLWVGRRAAPPGLKLLASPRKRQTRAQAAHPTAAARRALPRTSQAKQLLTLVWTGAGAGILQCLLFSRASKWLAATL